MSEYGSKGGCYSQSGNFYSVGVCYALQLALLAVLPLQDVLMCSYFVPNQSYPDQRQFFFAYAVTISNEGSDTVQLLNRHWVIHNAEGQKQEVRQA